MPSEVIYTVSDLSRKRREVGLQSAQQFYDHVAHAPGNPATINRTGVLRGKAGRPIAEGFSRTIHYEISGA